MQPGGRIGRYEIRRPLARGGMGQVYVARDPVLDREVAIKVLQGDLPGDASDRFVQEARSAAALNHVNIVTIHDVGGESSQRYIVMELVLGQTLADVIRRKTPIELGRRLRWLEDLCSGVAYAHSRKVIHRDIKPTNLIVDHAGRLKILDFGIARMLGTIASNATALVGTPGYMAPEQVLGGTIDHRSDIFSIGGVAYELLSYATAFPGENFAAITHRILTEKPVPLTQHVPELPETLVAVIDQAIAKKATERFDSAESLARAFAAARADLEKAGQDALLPSVDLEVASVSHTLATPRTGKEELARRRAEQIASALVVARKALHNGELEAAREACVQALTLDDANEEALDLERAVAQASSRARLGAVIQEAREELERGAFTAAQGLVTVARGLDPQGQDVRRLERDLRLARAAREEIRQRAEALKGALEAAEKALARGDIEAALVSSRQAAVLDSTSERARSLEYQAMARLNDESGTSTDPLEQLSGPIQPLSEPTKVVHRTSAVSGKPAPRTGPKNATGKPIVAMLGDGLSRALATSQRCVASLSGGVTAAVARLSRTGALVVEPGRQKPGSKPESRRLITGTYAWTAVGLLLVAGAVASYMLRTPAEPVTLGTLLIDAVPWATVTAIEASDGTAQPLPPDASTPLSLALPTGRYRVRLVGPLSNGQATEVNVELRQNAVTTAMPPAPFVSLTPEDYFDQYLVGEPNPDAPADVAQAAAAQSKTTQVVR